VAGSPQCGSPRLDPIAMIIPLGCARVGKRVGVGFQNPPPSREWPGEGLGLGAKLVITLGTKGDHFHDAMLGDYRPRAKRFDGGGVWRYSDLIRPTIKSKSKLPVVQSADGMCL
jgi:hypothetical protein